MRKKANIKYTINQEREKKCDDEKKCDETKIINTKGVLQMERERW